MLGSFPSAENLWFPQPLVKTLDLLKMRKKNTNGASAVCHCNAGYCCLCPSLCSCKCPLCAHMPLKLLTMTYCKQWRRLCPSFSSCFFFSSFLDPSVRPLWDIVFVQASPLYPHKQYVILEDGQRMFSHTHTHRASPHNTSWQLSRRITMTSNTERQSGHWAPSWTEVAAFLRTVTHDGKDRPHQSLLNH